MTYRIGRGFDKMKAISFSSALLFFSAIFPAVSFSSEQEPSFRQTGDFIYSLLKDATFYYLSAENVVHSESMKYGESVIKFSGSSWRLGAFKAHIDLRDVEFVPGEYGWEFRCLSGQCIYFNAAGGDFPTAHLPVQLPNSSDAPRLVKAVERYQQFFPKRANADLFK